MANSSIYIRGMNPTEGVLEIYGLVHYSPNSDAVLWFTQVPWNSTSAVIDTAIITAANNALFDAGVTVSPGDFRVLLGGSTVWHTGGITSNTYGNTSHVATITVDSDGRVNTAMNTAIAISAGAITSGTLAVIRGGTGQTAITVNGSLLIGNTVSGGFDVNPITQGTNITITNDKGSITIASSDAFAQTQANAAYDRANAAYANANTAIYTAAQIRANLSNTAPINYDAATGVISHALSGVTASGYGDAATVAKVVVDSNGHVTSVTNTAIAISAAAITSGTLAVARGGTGQTAITVNGSLLIGNTVSGGFDVNPITPGTNMTVTNDKGSITISSSDAFAQTQANAAYDRANAAYANANTAIYTAAQIRANISNTAPIRYDATTGIVSHADSGVTPSGYGDAATIPVFVANATGHISSVTNTAIAISASQITSGTLAVARGGTGQTAITVNGSLLIGNTVSGGFDVNPITQGTNITITNDKGSITISSSDAFAQTQANAAYDRANAAYANANTAIYTAAQIRANISNTAPIRYDATTGIVSHADSGVTPSGYGDAATIPVFVANATGHISSVVNTAIAIAATQITSGTLAVVRGGTAQTAINGNGSLLIGNTVSGGYDVNTLTQGTGILITNDKGSITIAATGGSAIDQYARDKANGAAQNAFVTLTVSGQSDVVADSNTDTLTIANTAPINITTDAGTDTVTWSHATSGVVATGHGDAATVPTFIVNATGHVTSVTNTAIAIAASQITSGTLAVARGGTGQTAITVNGSLLIGNTVSGGFDVNPITQGTNITVTNDKGSITIASSDAFAQTQANAAYDRANAAYANANTAIYTAAQIRANISNTAPIRYDATTGIVSHADSGVTPSGYGDAATIPVFVANATGHISSVTNTAIAISASQITSGTLAVARGGTAQTAINGNGSLLIGNTVSGGYDVNTLTQGTGILITNDKGSITIAATGGSAIDQYARDKANGAAQNAFITLVVAGQSDVVADSNTDTLTLVNTAPINLTTDAGTDTVTWSHADSGVVATGHGDAATVPKFIVNATGHVTSVTNTAIAISAAAITSGTLAVARGGTGQTAITVNGSLLIGNTVSGGFDVNPITQGTNITITNDKGSITIASSDAFAQTQANAAFDRANAAYANANTAIYTAAQIRANISNTTPIRYDATTGIVSHADSGVTPSGYGDAATIPVFVANATGHISSVVNTAIAISATQITSGTLAVARGGTGQTAITVNGSLLIGNTVSGGFDVNPITQGTNITITNDKGSITIASSDAFAQTQANAAYDRANAAYANANTAIYTAAQIRANISNTAPIRYDATTGIVSHADSGVTPSGYGDAATIPVFVANATGHISSVTNTAIAISATQITSGTLAVVRGGTAQTAINGNGSLLIGNTVSGGYDVNTLTQGTGIVITNDKGSITIAATGGASANGFGIIEVAGQANVVADQANDTLVLVGSGITLTTDAGTDTLTIQHPASGVTPSGYGDAATVPKVVVDANGHITSVVNTAIAISAAAITSGILAVARGGTGKDATGLVNGQFLIGNTVNAGFDLATIAQTAPVIVVNGQGTVTLSHASSGVVSGTYGGSNRVIGYTVDAFGHITVASNVAIDQLDASAIDTGTLAVARGGTGQTAITVNGSLLIGNTVSGGFDVNPITQGTNITITNDKGSITIASSDAFAQSQANAAYDRANAAYANANTAIYTAAQIRANISNTAPIRYDATTGIVSHADSGVVATGYGDAATIPVFVANATGHISSVTNTAIAISAAQITSGTLAVARGGTGQTAITVNGSLLIGNTVSGGFDVNPITQGSGILITNDKGSITIAATGGSSNNFGIVSVAGQSDIVAETSNDTLTIVGSGITLTTDAGTDTLTIQHPASGVTPSGYGDAATVPKFVVDANGHITSVVNTAIAISATAITSGILSVARGGTGKDATGLVNGQFLIGNTVNAGFDLATIAQTAPVIVVNGQGTVTLSHASSGVTSGTYGGSNRVIGYTVDAFGHITVASNVAIDQLDASAIDTGTLEVVRGGTGQSSYTNGQILIGNTGSTGLDKSTISQSAPVIVTNLQGSITISHARSGVVALDSYGSQAIIPVLAVDANGHITAAVNTAIGGLGTGVLTTGILPVARGGTGKDATGLANGQLLIGNTVNAGFDLVTIAQTAPVIVVNGQGTVTLSHASSGVVASGYGDGATVPKVVVDAFGHLTSVTNTAIAGLDAGVITTGTLVVARGGTGQSTYTNGQILIGNTGSTGLDKATIAQSAPVIVTNLQGSITISHARSGVVAATYGSQSLVPVFVVDANGHLTTVTDTAIGGLSASAITTGILAVARGGTGKDATGLVNGQFLIGNTVNAGFDLATIAQTAPVIVVNGQGTVTLSHASSGVVASGYGDGATVPKVVVDAFGHVTSVTNTAIAGLDAGVITTGTLVVARGGTGQSTYTNGQILIGNTGSTGLDKATIAQSAPVIVTNLQGSITISHARSGVVALDSYGSAAIVPVLAIDANGHITAAVNTTIAIPASAITSGTLAVARGGTGQTEVSIVNGAILIGNTVSGGYDINRITQGTGILINNDKGSIEIVATGGSATDQYARDKANGAVQTGFVTLVVAGQSDVVADSNVDTLTLVAGTNMTITTDAGTDTITFAASGGGGNSFGIANVAAYNVGAYRDVVADSAADTITLRGGKGILLTTNANNDVLTINATSDLSVTINVANVSVNTWSLSPTNDNQWNSVVWSPELGLFAAVAFDATANCVMTSPDGYTWTPRVTNTNIWFGIAWSPKLGLFAAVSATGSTNRVMTSPDGITWTTRTTNDNNWRDIAWSPELGLFAAVSDTGATNRVMTSPDGTTWTPQTTNDNSWRGITWSPELGLFAATSITGTSDRVMTSPDGVTWTTRTTNNNSWRDVEWSPKLGLFVAVSSTGTADRVMTSPNGVDWTTRTTINNDWFGVAWSPELGLFAAVSDTGSLDRLMTSPDGITWTIRPTNDNEWSGICWSPELGIFVAVAESGSSNRAMTSQTVGLWRTISRKVQPINDIFYENSQNVTANYTITTGKSAMSTGPITLGPSIVVTVPGGSRWVVI